VVVKDLQALHDFAINKKACWGIWIFLPQMQYGRVGMKSRHFGIGGV
jgi:hypothetical protein